jgi:aryl-phospho-beta-D-glucosidase BglC (GH1 family)
MIALLLLTAAACAQPLTKPPAHGVPAARLARLARCVDITRWFWEVDDVIPKDAVEPHATLAHFESYLGDADLGLIHQLGFRCVRLSIEPNLLYHKATPQAPDAAMLVYVDDAVRRLLAHDLAVVVDIHDDHPDKPFEHDPDYASGYLLFWQALAHHFSGWNADMVFLEALNEPVFQGRPEQWSPIQQRLLKAMRAGAPRLTLIGTGPLLSSVDGLVTIKPMADPDVVYSFHFYEPATFTHEGAGWWANGLDRYMSNLSYPSGSPQCKNAVATFSNADVRSAALAYCKSDWNTAKVDALIARAAGWSKVNGVPIIAGEFGVYCQHAPTAARLHWFQDVRAAFARYDIGWTLWGYDDCYGLGRQLDAQGHIVIDWDVAQALGLHAANTRLSATVAYMRQTSATR